MSSIFVVNPEQFVRLLSSANFYDISTQCNILSLLQTNMNLLYAYICFICLRLYARLYAPIEYP